MHPSLDIGLWSESVPDTAVMVADGQTAKVTVRHGRLLVEDGVPGNRRYREVTRVPREVSRLVILARHGYITFEALRWMRAARVEVTHLAEDITMTSGTSEGDWRILRSQFTDNDLIVSRYLVAKKVASQATTLDTCFGPTRASGFLRSSASEVQKCDEVRLIRGVEGKSSALYWNTWKGNVRVCWSPSDLLLVPKHWRAFPGRTSLAHTWETNRNATDPVNAMLNYAYKILESEALIACRALGLHPDAGVLHADGSDRHSFVLDLMEPVRPFCDKLVLDLIRSHDAPGYFSRQWCHELASGVCVLDPPLTHVIAGWAGDIGSVVQGFATAVRRVYRMGKCSHVESVDHIEQDSRTGKTTTFYKCAKCGEPMGSKTS